MIFYAKIKDFAVTWWQTLRSSGLHKLFVGADRFTHLTEMPHFLENIKVWIQYDAALWRELNTTSTTWVHHLQIVQTHWHRCDPHHISDNVVVPAFRSVDSQDAKHDKNHCPGVDQRTHRWMATCSATAWVKAKCFGCLLFCSRWGIFENRNREILIEVSHHCIFSISKPQWD